MPFDRDFVSAWCEKMPRLYCLSINVAIGQPPRVCRYEEKEIDAHLSSLPAPGPAGNPDRDGK
jgi:hypothetical protein